MFRSANICNKFQSVMKGGSDYDGFNVDFEKISFDALTKISNEGQVLEGGDSIFDSEENFNDYFLDCIQNNEVNGLNNCTNFIKKTKISTSGKVDVDKANQTLKNLGFTQNEHGLFENVLHWKDRVSENSSLQESLNNNKIPENRAI